MSSRTIDVGGQVGPAPRERAVAAKSRRRRWWTIGLPIVLALFAVGWIYGVDEPLRRHLESKLNATLDGYTVSIGKLDLHPIGLALDLEEVTVVQNASPVPPLLYAPRWTTSVEWRALLSGALVADVVFDRPQVFVTLDQASRESRDKKPMRERGWQQALTAVYPLEINEFRINGGEVHYFAPGLPLPVHLTDLDVRVENIRNVRSTGGDLPSPFAFDARWADSASIEAHGEADLLAEPMPTMRASYSVEGFELAPLDAMSRHANLRIERGTLASRGKIDLTARKRLAIESVSVSGAKIDYVEPRPAEQASPALEKAARAAAVPAKKPDFAVDVESAAVKKSTVGFVRANADPPYRVFLEVADLEVRGFSNQSDRRRGTAKMLGSLMGSGGLAVDAKFAAAAKRPDFSVDVRLERLELRTLNDFLRAENGLDVNDGHLAVYSQVSVRDGRIEGYLKPLISDIDVYDSDQDADDNILQKLYEAIVGGASTLLENRSRDEVATRTDLSGPVDNPEASALEVVIGLLQNAFFRAILPGLDAASEDRSGRPQEAR